MNYSMTLPVSNVSFRNVKSRNKDKNLTHVSHDQQMQQLVKLDDSILVKQFINGDDYSLEILVKRYRLRIFGFIYAKVLKREVVEDIVQDTFVKIIDNLKAGKYNEEGKFLPWAMRIANNLAMDYFRDCKKIAFMSKSEQFYNVSGVADSSLNAECQLMNAQMKQLISSIISELPNNQKEVLIMRMYKEMSFKDIAERTGTNINTALGRMRYGLINLKKNIEKNNIVLSNYNSFS